MMTKTDTDVTIVDRPYDPEETRKKGLRSPDETIRLAYVEAKRARNMKDKPGAVVHSEGHTTQNAARSAVKRIHAGSFGAWRDFKGRVHAYVVPYDDSTFGVGVTWTGPTTAADPVKPKRKKTG
jgi:hypothetical protein